MRGILGHRNGTLEGRLGDEVCVHPALVGDVGEERVEKRKVTAAGNRQMKHVFCPGNLLAAVHCHGAAGIDDDHLRPVLHPLDHVVQEQVGLAFHRVGADQHDRVGDLIVGIGVVQLVHAHVAGAVHL